MKPVKLELNDLFLIINEIHLYSSGKEVCLPEPNRRIYLAFLDSEWLPT